MRSMLCALILVGCTQVAARAAPEPFVPPRTTQSTGGWELYVDPPTYTANDVRGLAPGSSSPEAAVVHYFASRVRGDQRYREVLPAEGDRSSHLRHNLAEHDQWIIRRFRLVSRSSLGFEFYQVRVYMDVRVGSETEDGEDEVEVRRIGGRWTVVEVPT